MFERNEFTGGKEGLIKVRRFKGKGNSEANVKHETGTGIRINHC